MSKVGVFYWSGTGNTEKMANLICKGLEKANCPYDLFNISYDLSSIQGYDKILFGCPAMGAEVLEEAEFEPFFESVESSISGKKVGLFGSYSWADGQWMRDWEQRTKDTGANLYNDEGLIVFETPEGESEEKCIEFGEGFAKF